MTQRKSLLITLIAVLVLPLVFMLSAYGCGNKEDNLEPLPEGYYRITKGQTTGGKVNVSKQSAREGEEITLSYDANSGYFFVNYVVKTTDNEAVAVIDDSFTMPAKDVVVSGTFERFSNEKYSVEIVPALDCIIEIVSPGEEQLARNEGKIQAGTRVVLACYPQNGYEVKSWNVTGANGNRVTVNSDNSFIMPNSNVTISAVVGEITYTVSVDTETAKMIDVTIKDDDNNVIENGGTVKYATRVYISYEFKVQGYALTGWKNQDGESIDTSPAVFSNLVISATFSPNQYHLTVDNRWNDSMLNEMNGRGGISLYLTNKDGNRIDQLVNTSERNRARTGEEITIHCETRNQNFAVDYYILRYYKDDGSLYNEHISTNKFDMRPNTVTVSAQLKLVENTYNVDYVLSGGELANDTPVVFNSTDDSLRIPNPTRQGYKFDGWEEDNNYNRMHDENSITFYPYQIDSTLTLTAKWIKAATITYDYSSYSPYNLDGFNGKYVDDNNPTTYVLGEYTVLQNPIYAYGQFEGWYTSPTFEEESKITELYVENEDDLADMTLYAKMRLKSFHINFVKIGVSSNGTKILATSAYLDWINLAEDPRDLTRDMYNEKTYTVGYTFVGFFTDANLTEPITEVSNELDHSITIYAKETLDTYTITFYERGIITNTNSYTIETESIWLPNGSNFDNAYGHWIFRGWRLNNIDTGEQFAFPTTIYPSQNPEKFHGNLAFYAYYQEP